MLRVSVTHLLCLCNALWCHMVHKLYQHMAGHSLGNIHPTKDLRVSTPPKSMLRIRIRKTIFLYSIILYCQLIDILRNNIEHNQKQYIRWFVKLTYGIIPQSFTFFTLIPSYLALCAISVVVEERLRVWPQLHPSFITVCDKSRIYKMSLSDVLI